MDEIRYDIVAVPPKEIRSTITDHRSLVQNSDTRLPQMLQVLLASRFQLRCHVETKTGNVYLLQKGKKPPAFTPTTIDLSEARGTAFLSIGRHGQQWEFRAATMPELASFLSRALGSPVLDQTGLSGKYDYKQRVINPDAIGLDANAPFMAFFSELHLSLIKSKGPVDTLVIDSAQKASPN
jgi:uncharacterized protein (TIGR03435 family)